MNSFYQWSLSPVSAVRLVSHAEYPVELTVVCIVTQATRTYKLNGPEGLRVHYGDAYDGDYITNSITGALPKTRLSKGQRH